MKVEDSGPIDALKKPEEIRAEPLGLPAGFEWSTIDVLDDAQVREPLVTVWLHTHVYWRSNKLLL